MDENVIHIFLW